MILRTLGKDALSLKTATAMVQIKSAGDIRINDRDIEGPGEYDIAGVGVHAFEGYAVLFTEGVRLAVVWDDNAKLDSEDETNIDVVMFLNSDAKQINTVIKEQDPRVVVFLDEAIASQVATGDGMTLAHESNYKLTSALLPAEDRQFIVLSA